MRQNTESTCSAATEYISGFILFDDYILEYITRFILYLATNIKLLGAGGMAQQEEKYYMANGLQPLRFMFKILNYRQLT